MNCTGLGLDLSRILSTMSLICFARTSPYWVVQPPWLSLALYSMTPTENWLPAMTRDAGPADHSAKSASAAGKTCNGARTRILMAHPKNVRENNRSRKLVARSRSVNAARSAAGAPARRSRALLALLLHKGAQHRVHAPLITGAILPEIIENVLIDTDRDCLLFRRNHENGFGPVDTEGHGAGLIADRFLDLLVRQRI